jgi:DNA-binding NarL/FixJ family response regulator
MTPATHKEDRETRKRTIYLVDDHPVIRKGLAELINQRQDLAVCGAASTPEEALQQVPRLKPDLVVVDLALQDSSGLDLLRILNTRHPDLPVMILSMHDEGLYAKRALRAGAKGYIMKREAIDELIAAIHQVLAGRIYLSPKMSDRMLRHLAQDEKAACDSPVDVLSDRELEVFELLGAGHGAKEIARRLHLSVSTIETYQGRLKEKLQLRDATELFQHALEWVHGKQR